MYDPIRPVIESDGEELFLLNRIEHNSKERRKNSFVDKSSLNKIVKKHSFISKEE